VPAKVVLLIERLKRILKQIDKAGFQLKESKLRYISILLIIILLASISAGCSNSKNPDAPEFIFKAEIILLPDDISEILNVAFANDVIYFTAQRPSEPQFSTIYSMNTDGSNLQELQNYKSARPPQGAMGFLLIDKMCVDDRGDIWVFEIGSFSDFDFPEGFDETTGDTWEHIVEIESIRSLRKLNHNGAGLVSLDVRALTGNEDFSPRSLCSDNTGNVYINGADSVYVLDSDGNLLFEINPVNDIERLVKMSDGSVAAFERGTHERNPVLREIKTDEKGWGAVFQLPSYAGNIYSGTGDHRVIFSDFTSLYGLEKTSGESVRILNWIDSGISIDGMFNIFVLSDDHILYSRRNINTSTGMRNVEIIDLTRVPYDGSQIKTVLTLATFGWNHFLQRAVLEFNKTNEKYHIQIVDYDDFSVTGDSWAGLTRLLTEIIAGRVPDIIDTNHLPVHQFVSKGLLEDLYPYIDSDPGSSRSALVESVMKLSEIEGGLYRIYTGFNVASLIGDPLIVGEGMGWNIEEFYAMLQANPQADMPLGPFINNTSFLAHTVFAMLDRFVDYTNGTCSFDTDDFVRLLEISGTFPSEQNHDYDYPELIRAGRQLMMPLPLFGSFREIQLYKAMFGGDIEFKGFPANNGIGNTVHLHTTLAMTSTCADKQGAWEFLRMLLSEEWQRDIYADDFWIYPSNSVVFNELMETAMTPVIDTDASGNEIEVSQSHGWGDLVVDIYSLTQEEADKITALINTASFIRISYDYKLLDIIVESASDFFEGRSTAHDAARVIQSRASIYLAEQS